MRTIERAVELPTMVRVSRLAEVLSTTPYWVVKFCKANGVPIARAGVQKIRMIPKEEFFQKLEQESKQ